MPISRPNISTRDKASNWIVIALCLVGCSKRPTQFSAAAWQAATVQDGQRLQMLPDLLDRHEIVGMHRGDVEKLLGTPDREKWTPQLPYPGYQLAWIEIDGLLRDRRVTALVLIYDADKRVIGYKSKYRSYP